MPKTYDDIKQTFLLKQIVEHVLAFAQNNNLLREVWNDSKFQANCHSYRKIYRKTSTFAKNYVQIASAHLKLELTTSDN